MYQAAVIIHILSAITWLGGTLFLLMVLIPLARKQVDSPMQGMMIVRQAAQRFLPVAWASIFLLAVTGIYLATGHWNVSVGDFFSGEGRFIQVLRVKTGLAALVIILSLAHDFVLGPRVMNKLEAARATGGPPPGIPGGKMILMIARVNLVMVLAILCLAVFLIRP